VLRRAGTPVPANDVWIAAVTMGTAGILVTFDSDFSRVPGLRCIVLD
jgi:predicted nucleic acid-binding protein